MKAFCGVRKPIFVRQTASEGTPIKRITHITGLSHQLVRQILRGEREGVLSIRQSSLDHWLLWIECEWTGGGHNAAELWRRLRAARYAGSPRVFGAWRPEGDELKARPPRPQADARQRAELHER